MATRSMEGPDLPNLVLRDVALYLGLSESTINRLIAEGRFPRARKWGGQNRWLAEDVAAWRQIGERLIPDGSENEAPEKDS